MMRSRPLAAAAVLVALLSACGSAPGTTDPEGVDGLTIPTPFPDPDDYVEVVDNPYLPLAPGSTWTYDGTWRDGESVTVEVEVAAATDEVAGIEATVVTETVVDEAGRTLEARENSYAQDTDGNVWLLGIAGTTYAGGSGPWVAGTDGAEAGLAMPAFPRQGDGYREGSAPGVFEDVAEVIRIDAEVELVHESYDAAVEIEVTSPLEPGRVVRRFYVRGVGLVAWEAETGGDEELVLAAHQPG